MLCPAHPPATPLPTLLRHPHASTATTQQTHLSYTGREVADGTLLAVTSACMPGTYTMESVRLGSAGAICSAKARMKREERTLALGKGTKSAGDEASSGASATPKRTDVARVDARVRRMETAGDNGPAAASVDAIATDMLKALPCERGSAAEGSTSGGARLGCGAPALLARDGGADGGGGGGASASPSRAGGTTRSTTSRRTGGADESLRAGLAGLAAAAAATGPTLARAAVSLAAATSVSTRCPAVNTASTGESAGALATHQLTHADAIDVCTICTRDARAGCASSTVTSASWPPARKSPSDSVIPIASERTMLAAMWRARSVEN